MEQCASWEANSYWAGQKFYHPNNLWVTVQIVKIIVNEHLPPVLSVCPLPQTARTYPVRCATESTLSLVMSTQSVDRAADGTEVLRSVLSHIWKWNDRFESSRDIWQCNEGYVVCTVHTVHTVHIVHNVHTVHTLHTVQTVHTLYTVHTVRIYILYTLYCTYSTYCAHCAYCISCTYCAYTTYNAWCT
jgi:hypothetical protein